MVIFYKKWKKYNEIQLTKNKMDLNIPKMTNHPPSPAGGRTKVYICRLREVDALWVGRFSDQGVEKRFRPIPC